MTTNQLLFAIAGLMLTLFGMAMAFFKYYVDAKIDPLSKSVDMLVQYLISHEGKIARLEGDYFYLLSDDELRAKAHALRSESRLLLRKAYRCEAIISRREAVVALRTAQAAIDRAENSVCTEGVGDCPVHQMGSCKVVETSTGLQSIAKKCQ